MLEAVPLAGMKQLQQRNSVRNSFLNCGLMSSWCLNLHKQIKNHIKSFRKTVNSNDTASTCSKPLTFQGYLPFIKNFQSAEYQFTKTHSLRIHQIPGSGRLWNSDKVALIRNNLKVFIQVLLFNSGRHFSGKISSWAWRTLAEDWVILQLP